MKAGVFKDTLGELFAEAEARGEAKGELKHAHAWLVKMIEKRFGKEALELEADIQRLDSREVLERLLDFALDCASLDEFRTRLKSER